MTEITSHTKDIGRFDYTEWAAKLTHTAHDKGQYEIAEKVCYTLRPAPSPTANSAEPRALTAPE